MAAFFSIFRSPYVVVPDYLRRIYLQGASTDVQVVAGMQWWKMSFMYVQASRLIFSHD